MENLKWLLTIIVLVLFSNIAVIAQGPPITGDKPIMLAPGNFLLKTLTEIRNTEKGVFTEVPLMFHYLPIAKVLVAVHIPFVNYNYNFNAIEGFGKGQTLGDIELLAKYQLFRKDKMGKTFRGIAKTLQTLPTGKELNIEGMSTGKYQSYMAFVAGYETIRYGISNELGYNVIPDNDQDELRYKLGFGLPLLKPVYPVKQINLYFEYQSSWFTEQKEYMLLYAQGIQYARDQLTLDLSIQLPLIQTVSKEHQRNYSLFLGTRYVF